MTLAVAFEIAWGLVGCILMLVGNARNERRLFAFGFGAAFASLCIIVLLLIGEANA